MVQATGSIFTGDSDPALWIKLLLGYDIIFTTVSLLLFDVVIDDSNVVVLRKGIGPDGPIVITIPKIDIKPVPRIDLRIQKKILRTSITSSS